MIFIVSVVVIAVAMHAHMHNCAAQEKWKMVKITNNYKIIRMYGGGIMHISKVLLTHLIVYIDGMVWFLNGII